MLNLKERRFGRLVAKEATSKRKHRYVVWICLCDCGNTVPMDSCSLTSGWTKSCGCLRRETSTLRNIARRKRPYEYLYNAIVRAAAEECRVCDLTYKEFIELIAMKECFYCGTKISWPTPFTPHGKTAPYNLDRKDNSRGYSKDNVVVCCWPCNSGKGIFFTFEEWVVMARSLRNYRETTDS